MFDSIVSYQQCKKLITRYTQVSSTNSGSSRDPFLKWGKQKSRPESISIAEALKRYKGDKGVNLSRNTQYSYYITNTCIAQQSCQSERPAWKASMYSSGVQSPGVQCPLSGISRGVWGHSSAKTINSLAWNSLHSSLFPGWFLLARPGRGRSHRHNTGIEPTAQIWQLCRLANGNWNKSMRNKG